MTKQETKDDDKKKIKVKYSFKWIKKEVIMSKKEHIKFLKFLYEFDVILDYLDSEPYNLDTKNKLWLNKKW